MDRLIVCKTDKGNYAVRPINWAGIWDKNGSIQEIGLNHTAIFYNEQDANDFAELAQAKRDGRVVVLPCKVGDTVYVDTRTIYSGYFHPCDGVKDFAKCEVVSIVTAKKETYLKLRGLYPSRQRRRDYLRYGITAIGKTVFLTPEAAANALKEREAE